MRLFLRLVGTWLLGLALILLILDGTRSLAAGSFVATPLAATWTSLHAASLEEVRAFFGTRFFGAVLEAVLDAGLALPGWVVLGAPGGLLAWLGRTRGTRVFVRQDHY